MSQCKVPKPPESDKSRYLGIEFEMVSILNRSNPQSLFDIMPDFAGWVVVNYESLGRGLKGWEAKFLVKENDLDLLFPTFIQTLVSAGATVNSGCGLHVHLDCRNRLKSYVGSQIRANDLALRKFCKNADRPGMYNSWCDRGYETIECRLMEANFDTQRILDYIHALIGFVDAPDVEIAA